MQIDVRPSRTLTRDKQEGKRRRVASSKMALVSVRDRNGPECSVLLPNVDFIANGRKIIFAPKEKNNVKQRNTFGVVYEKV